MSTTGFMGQALPFVEGDTGYERYVDDEAGDDVEGPTLADVTPERIEAARETLRRLEVVVVEIERAAVAARSR